MKITLELIIGILSGMSFTSLVWFVGYSMMKRKSEIRKKQHDEIVDELIDSLIVIEKTINTAPFDEIIKKIETQKMLVVENIELLGKDMIIVAERFLYMYEEYIKMFKRSDKKPAQNKNLYVPPKKSLEKEVEVVMEEEEIQNEQVVREIIIEERLEGSSNGYVEGYIMADAIPEETAEIYIPAEEIQNKKEEMKAAANNAQNKQTKYRDEVTELTNKFEKKLMTGLFQSEGEKVMGGYKTEQIGVVRNDNVAKERPNEHTDVFIAQTQQIKVEETQ